MSNLRVSGMTVIRVILKNGNKKIFRFKTEGDAMAAYNSLLHDWRVKEISLHYSNNIKNL